MAEVTRNPKQFALFENNRFLPESPYMFEGPATPPGMNTLNSLGVHQDYPQPPSPMMPVSPPPFHPVQAGMNAGVSPQLPGGQQLVPAVAQAQGQQMPQQQQQQGQMPQQGMQQQQQQQDPMMMQQQQMQQQQMMQQQQPGMMQPGQPMQGPHSDGPTGRLAQFMRAQNPQDLALIMSGVAQGFTQPQVPMHMAIQQRMMQQRERTTQGQQDVQRQALKQRGDERTERREERDRNKMTTRIRNAQYELGQLQASHKFLYDDQSMEVGEHNIERAEAYIGHEKQRKAGRADMMKYFNSMLLRGKETAPLEKMPFATNPDTAEEARILYDDIQDLNAQRREREAEMDKIKMANDRRRVKDDTKKGAFESLKRQSALLRSKYDRLNNLATDPVTAAIDPLGTVENVRAERDRVYREFMRINDEMEALFAGGEAKSTATEKPAVPVEREGEKRKSIAELLAE